MDRYTRKHAEEAFKRLCGYMNKRIAENYNDVGAYRLDANPSYGGYVVEEISNAQGGIRHPFGSQRRNAREFCDVVLFIRDFVYEQEQSAKAQQRLEYLRGELRAERISYEEVAELQSLAHHISPDDTELREAAGLPEQG